VSLEIRFSFNNADHEHSTHRLSFRKASQRLCGRPEQLSAGTEYGDLSLEKIASLTAGRAEKAAIFNNAAQVWNHTLYANSMKAKGGGTLPPSRNRK